jgi:hypothetical protein
MYILEIYCSLLIAGFNAWDALRISVPLSAAPVAGDKGLALLVFIRGGRGRGGGGVFIAVFLHHMTGCRWRFNFFRHDQRWLCSRWWRLTVCLWGWRRRRDVDGLERESRWFDVWRRTPPSRSSCRSAARKCLLPDRGGRDDLLALDEPPFVVVHCRCACVVWSLFCVLDLSFLDTLSCHFPSAKRE